MGACYDGYKFGVIDTCDRILERLERLKAEHEEREETARKAGLTMHADLNAIKANVLETAIEIVLEEKGE